MLIFCVSIPRFHLHVTWVANRTSKPTISHVNPKSTTPHQNNAMHNSSRSCHLPAWGRKHRIAPSRIQLLQPNGKTSSCLKDNQTILPLKPSPDPHIQPQPTPTTHTAHVPQCHMYVVLVHLQGQWLYHLLGQPAPMPHHFEWKIFLTVNLNLPWSKLMPFSLVLSVKSRTLLQTHGISPKDLNLNPWVGAEPTKFISVQGVCSCWVLNKYDMMNSSTRALISVCCPG